MGEMPVIILTHRRSGGTSLSSFLSAVSSYGTIEDEPFNPGRALSHIREAYAKSGDVAALRRALEEVVATKSNIKHCVEMTSWTLTRQLIEICHRAGYFFLVLTRENETQRLMSLLVAKSTAAWGPDTARTIYPEIESGRKNAQPIDLNDIEAQFRRDFASRGYALSVMQYMRIPYMWVTFEQLYFGNRPVEDQALDIAGMMGIDLTPEEPNLKRFTTRGGQKTSSIKQFIPNYAEAEKRAAAVCGIDP